MAKTEKPILFNGDMVRALQDGRKTQTRRLIKPSAYLEKYCKERWGGWKDAREANEAAGTAALLAMGQGWKYAPYSVGDTLWVKEAWCYVGETHQNCPSICSIEEADKHIATVVKYRADDVHRTVPGRFPWRESYSHDWLPSIHMPRWAARLFLEVTNVRVERVQEISEEDAKAEGVEPVAEAADVAYRTAFNSLWWKMYRDVEGDKCWDANPYVRVIEFRQRPELTIFPMPGK